MLLQTTSPVVIPDNGIRIFSSIPARFATRNRAQFYSGTFTEVVAQTGEAVTVKDSPIHGKGLFAARNLKIGVTLLRMNPDSFALKHRHPWNGRNRDILPYFINHSCAPNVALIFSAGEVAMLVVATKPIKVEAEITLDYHLIELGGKRITCCCGAQNCRGTFPINVLGA